MNVVKVDRGEGDGLALIHTAAERNIGRYCVAYTLADVGTVKRILIIYLSIL